MRQTFLHIVLLIWIGFLPGCRGQRQMETTQTQQSTSEIGVEFHELERFWNSMAERLNLKIEFYPAEGGLGLPTTDNCVPIDPNAEPVPPSPQSSGVGFGIGSVKSLEFSSERVVSDSSLARTDSIADFKSDSASEAHTEKASELRQDNGTWAILAVVAAVVFILIVLIVIKKFFKK